MCTTQNVFTIRCLSVCFYFVTLVQIKHYSATRYCGNAHECYGETLNEGAACYGDHSCAFAEFGSSTGPICGGAYSCFGSPLMQKSTSSAFFTLWCDGLYSCAMTNLITNQGYSDSNVWSGFHIDCGGEQSCFGTTFFHDKTPIYIKEKY